MSSGGRIAGGFLVGGGGGCFLGHTLVRTPGGQQAIESLQPGDLVVSFDDRGNLHHGKVLKVHVHEGERVIRYRLWGGAVLDATPNHWVLNQFNAFVEIDTIGSDDCLVDENGHLRPIVSREEHGIGTVYNLTVEGHHTFIAGGIRVHNAGLGLGVIAGAGGDEGKGGGGHTPSEATDNLNSTQYATVLDLISEGEIQGLKDGLKSIYLNNTPLQNADGSMNFQGVTVSTRNGTQDQTYIPLNSAVTNELPVAVQVSYGTPVVRTITSPTVNAVRVTITVPALQQFQDNGDVVGSLFALEIHVQYNGGGYTPAKYDTILGRTADQYQRDYLINLSGAFPVNIKVLRTTPDSTSAKIQNAFSWFSYAEITYAKLRYPNSALVAMRVDAEQFNSIPTRSYLVRGVKVNIPSNATVDTATGALLYTGVWNGTFGAAQWTTDPAWILWDLLTSDRYGFGDHVQAAQLDKWAFYSASQYCTAQNTYLTDGSGRTGATNDYNATTGRHGVPDGFGNYEPRFSCNANIQTAEEAYKLINDMASVFRAMPFWSTGSLTVTQDKPVDPSYLFTYANVAEGGFSYQGGSLKTRPTVAVVSWLNLTTRQMDYEVVEDQAAIAKYGVITRQVSAFACTSRGQAHRLGEWLLYSEQYESEVVSFIASIDAGVVVRPGQVIEISDPMRAGQRRGGRISAATTTTVTVDDATGLPLSGGTVSVILPTGAVATQVMTSRTGNVLTVSASFGATPNVNSVWIYESNEIQASTWRVLSVTEQDGAQYAISALAYNASKYAYIERGVALEQRTTTNLNEIPAAPINLQLTEALYQYQGQVRAKVLASWRPVIGVSSYRVRWRKDDGNWSEVPINGPDHEILDITPGSFDFEVFSVSAAFRSSRTALTGTINALGKTAPPSAVTNLRFTVNKDLGALLLWDAVPDIDLAQYEVRRGTNWGSASLVTQINATSYKLGALDDGTFTYLVKAIDTSGVYSTNAASVSVTVAPANATTVTPAIQGSDLVLSWAAPAITTYEIAHYRVTYGNSYATSVELAKTQSTSFTVPATWTGTRTFWVAPVDLVGRFTDPPGNAVVTITGAAAPVITASAGGTTATLTWTAVAGTLPTDSYEIRQGATFATATVLANITGTSYTLRATWAGSQTFWVVAKDVNGNPGTAGSVAVTINVAAAPALTSSFSGQNVVFTWAAVQGTLDTDRYLLKRGATWASAATVATIYSTAYTLKADWGGIQKFWLAAVDVNGAEGSPNSLDVTVSAPTAPTMTQQVIDNNVLLRWNDVTQTLPITSYELRRGATWAGGTVIGTKQGGFTTVFETASGTYVYWLAGIDSAGNYGTPGSVSAVVNQPPDYVLQFSQNSTWAGTETNILTDSVLGQIVNVNTAETWQSHFTSRGYTSPQDQVSAGFTYFLMPSTTTAAYQEDFDYGTVLAGTKVTATLTSSAIAGSTTITPTISVRQLVTDPWTSYPGLSEVFVTQFRYFRVRYDFTSAGGDDLMLLTGLNVRLDAKLRNDAGSGTASSGDVGGTTVTFTVQFVDIQSISVTPLSTSGVIAVYDFVDAPNPTSFKVLLFNTSGTRVSGPFSWSARGV